jgi:hypothetical protein
MPRDADHTVGGMCFVGTAVAAWHRGGRSKKETIMVILTIYSHTRIFVTVNVRLSTGEATALLKALSPDGYVSVDLAEKSRERIRIENAPCCHR